MTDTPAGPALLRLLSWLSPAFPVGAFAYSHGLESAVHEGLVHDRASLQGWLSVLVAHGSGWNDAVLLAEAWREATSGGDAGAVAELGQALAGSRERHLETTLQGAAFGEAVSAWLPGLPSDLPYPVAVGVAAGRSGVALEAALLGFLHAFSANLVQAALRLVPLGQRDGVATLAAFEPLLLDTAARAARSSLDDLGSSSTSSDILSMRHEALYSRVFRS
ncbi:MAG: urease accessory protein UreF [Mesorhizobium amorphae]|nr:MAG: urease accessory protein UreF [Mesorhizobium amorphae]